MTRLFDGEVDVAYMQFYVETPEVIPQDVGRRFAGQTNGLCGAGEPGMLQCTTGLHTGLVPVAVELLDTAPDDLDDGATPGAVDGWEEVVEVSLITTTPTVLLFDWDHQHPVELAFGEGTFRVRYHASGLEAGRDADTRGLGEPVFDRYLLQVWPADPAPDVVLRQTSELAGYWHDTARTTSAAGAQDNTEDKATDEARLAAFHKLIQDLSMSSPELQRLITSWLAQRTARIAGPAATAWVRPALDALERNQPLPAPFDDREATRAAAHHDLGTAPIEQGEAGRQADAATLPNATAILLNVVTLGADSDPTKAVMGALAAAQLVNRRPESELLAELRARFLPAAPDFLGLTDTDARNLAQDRHWVVRDKTPGGFYTDDYHPERINIWLDEHGVVARAEIG